MKEQLLKEIELLDRACGLCANPVYMRYESLSRSLESVGFPYRLVSTWKKGVRGNFYYWSSSWDSGSIYLQETPAFSPVRGVRRAVAVLRGVLRSYS